MDRSLLSVASEIVAAYVSKNSLPAGDVPNVLMSVHDALSGLGRNQELLHQTPEPKVSIKKSVTPDYIVCLEDGKHFKSLRRHLNTAYNMSPAEYRAKWGLPHDYPMTAANYTAVRSELAKSIGLGRKGATAKAAAKAKKQTKTAKKAA